MHALCSRPVCAIGRSSPTRMADDNGPWFDGLIEEFDRVHRGRAIENRKNVVAMCMRGHAANDFPYNVRYEPYIARLVGSGVNEDKRIIFIVWVCVEPLCVDVEAVVVGRPMLKNPDNPNPNPHEGLHDEDPYRRPTVAYHWDQVSVYTGSSHVRYKCYVNELDTLTAEQVLWRPYEEDREYDLNQMCTRDSNIWRSRCPMICFYAVEFHFVDRVARQFGKRQGIPTEETRSVITSLHGFSRRNNQDISDWAVKHHHVIAMWNERETLIDKENRPHNDSAYQKYLVWYADCYRLKLKPGWTREEWSELVSEDPSAAEGYHAFNMVVRETGGSQVDYAPMHDELGREFLMCVNDANVALSHPRGGASSERTLRTTLEKFKSRFHKWAAMLSCHGAQSVDVFTGGTSRSSRARRRQLTIDDIEEEEEEETTQEHEVDIDAPQPSQLSQSRKKKTPRAARKKRLNFRFRSPEYNRKNLPKGMRYIEEEEDEEEEEEEDIEEEEAEGRGVYQRRGGGSAYQKGQNHEERKKEVK
ncbi:hypothetical protein D1007_55371 [Hordeum vulgare]|nr:hypothetical protein D1007_55371 [Hordeum vulgare]